MKKSIVPVCWTSFLCVVLLALTSCDNFLKNENISNEIKDTIAYNNAQIVKVNLYCKEGMGTIYPDNYYDAHVGFDFKLQFIPNKKNYELRNPEKIFEAVNIKNESKKMSDYVQITYIPQTEEEGVYSYNVKVLQASNDIRIRLIDDPNPPKFNTIRIARTKDDAIKGTNLIPYEEFTGDDDSNPNLFIHYADNVNYEGDSSQVAQNIQDHHVNKIWIYFEAEDSESGVDYIEVKEQLIRQTDGNTIQGIIYDKSTNERTNSIYNKTGNNNFSACFEYTFLSKEDGVANIELIAFDYGGKHNTSAQKIDFVKDTICNLNVNFEPENNQFIEILENPHNVEYKIKIQLSSVPMNFFIKDLNDITYRDTFSTTTEGDFSRTGNLISFGYGYNKNYMTFIYFQDMNEFIKQPVVSFSVDPYKTVYINATIEDLAGNRKTSSLEITPVPDIVGADIAVTDKKGEITFITSNDTEGGVFFNVVDNSYVGAYNNNCRNILSSYYVNTMPDSVRFVQRNNMAFYGKSIILRKCKSDENKTENDSFEIESTGHYKTPTTSDIPDITINVDSPINTGKKYVRISRNPSFTPNPDFVYLYSYFNKEAKEIFFQENTLELEYNNVATKLWVYVCNKDGAFIKSAVPCVINEITVDNVAPFIGSFSLYKISQGKCLASLLYTDANHYNNSSYGNSGIKEIKYLFTENKVDGNSIDWNNNPNIKIPEEKDSLSEALYTHTYLFDYSYCNTLPSCLYIYVKDKNGNYTIKEIYPFVTERVFDYTFEYVNNSFKFECVGNNSNKPLCEYLKDSTWQPISAATGYGYLSLTNNADRIHASKTFALSEDEKASFIKISPYDDDFLDLIGPVAYYYPPYLIDKDSYTCELKDMLIGLSGINIFADQPCFVHTLYCRRNLGEKPEDWMGYEYKCGYEVGPVIKQKTFTYSNDYIDQVPSGYYYTTIVHFADGTMMMTPVQLMQ